MKEFIVIRIILTIIIIGLIIFFYPLVRLFIYFKITSTYYMILLLVFFSLIILYILFKIWIDEKPKFIAIMFRTLLTICLILIITFNINQFYHNNMVKRIKNEVEWMNYLPFQENEILAKLEEPSTLKFKPTDKLPTLDGATALFPLYSTFVQATYPQINYELDNSFLFCSTTSEAYKSLIKGEVDIIFVAGPSQQQIDMAKSYNVELKLTPIGYEAFVFFVNSKNPINELSSSDIRKIYSGEITNWNQVGGKNKKIIAFQRPENSGSQTALIKFMGDNNLIPPEKEKLIARMGGIIEQVANYRNYNNAIGYSFLFYSTEMVQNNQIKLLSLDRTAPTRENVTNKTYPLSSEFYAVTAGSENPNIDIFINWILSEQGQYLIEKTGYTPLAKTK